MNEPEYTRVRNMLKYAADKGLDRVAMLDAYDLLLTSAAKKRIQLDTLRDFRNQFNELQAHQLARRIRWDAPVTSAEMFDAIASYLDDYITMKEKEATS
jgi:hypothetical protein